MDESQIKEFLAQKDVQNYLNRISIDINEIDEYMDERDWRVKESANSSFCMATLNNYLSGSLIARYVLEKYYPKNVADAHRKGFIHIHDLSCGMVAYCAGWSLKDLIKKGFVGKNGRASAGPAKHFDTILQQMANFIATLQTEWAGAQAFNSFDTFLAPFVKHDGLNYKQVKQSIQNFIFQLNIASRSGQSPFSNLTIDMTCPEDLKNVPVVIGGEENYDSFYSDYQPEMDMINKAFLEIMYKGDHEGKIFSFPIPTYNITKDFPWDSEISRLLFKATGRYGLPYFQNFINSDLDVREVRSMCCRLQMDIRQLKKKTGGLFGASDLTGSVGVCTLNMPRLCYLSNGDTNELFRLIKEYVTISVQSLEIKRLKVSENLKRGLMPYTSIYLKDFDHHFSTVGLLGMNEGCQNFFKDRNIDITTRQGKELAEDVLVYMRGLLQEAQTTTGNIYNLEATPGEGTTFRFANLDRKEFGDKIIQSGTGDNVYYTNSTQLPVGYTSDIIQALNHQESLQSKYSGGTVFHAFLGESIESSEVIKNMVKNIATNYHIPYFTITPTFSICPVHGYISGAHEKCPFDVDNSKPIKDMQ